MYFKIVLLSAVCVQLSQCINITAIEYDCPSSLYTVDIHKEVFQCFNSSDNLHKFSYNGLNRMECDTTTINVYETTGIPYRKCPVNFFDRLVVLLERSSSPYKHEHTQIILSQFLRLFDKKFASTQNNNDKGRIELFFTYLNRIPNSRKRIDLRLEHLIMNSDYMYQKCMEAQAFHGLIDTDSRDLRELIYNLKILYFNDHSLKHLKYIERTVKKVEPIQRELMLSLGLKLYNLSIDKLVYYCYAFSEDQCDEILKNMNIKRLQFGYAVKKQNVINQNTPTL